MQSPRHNYNQLTRHHAAKGSHYQSSIAPSKPAGPAVLATEIGDYNPGETWNKVAK